MTAFAYEDGPLPIGEGQTSSQPYIVALMSELLRVKAGEKVLEVGTGSGYQAAVLADMGVEVYTIEIVESLALSARKVLEELEYEGIRFRVGDGYRGWTEAAPFDGVIVTAAPDHVPQPLIDQLREGARMVIPVGAMNQELLVLTRTAEGVRREVAIPVRFVPMTGEAQIPPH
jgi:protein-L-isoaspartate(D-aspartate) O-methyltransferase